MTEDSHMQIILGRPLLATVGYKIDAKEGKLTFDVGEHHVEFGLFKGCNSFPCTFSCYGCEVVDPDELVSMLDMTPNYPSIFDCALFEGHGLDGVTVESLPPNIIEDKPYVINKGYLGDCCRFITLLMSMPPMSGSAHELDVDIGLQFGPSDGASPHMIVFLDLTF